LRSASNYNDVDVRSERVARAFEIPILVAALLVIPVIVVEESAVGEPWKTIAALLNWAIWLAFVTELVVMPRRECRSVLAVGGKDRTCSLRI
jgi:hypothetical protein